MALIDKLNAIGDAIRAKTGKYDLLTLDQMPLEIEGITGGGGDDVAKSIVDKSIASYSDSTVTTVGGYSFVDCDKMTSVSVPSATTLGNYAFSSCGALSSVNIPSVTTLGQYAFNACTSLETISGGEVTATGNYSFTGCTALSSVNFPKLVTIAQYAFQNCTALTEFDGEEVTTIATYAFTGCSALTSFNLPKAKSVGAYAFNGAGASHISLPSMTSMSSGAFRGSRFVSVDLPNVTNVANNAFRAQGYIKRVTFPKAVSTSSEAMRNCTALEYVDFPVLTAFGTYTFQDCTKLATLILRTTSKVVPLGNANILGNTAIAAGNGHVYVPASLLSGYQTATNWSTYANQIRAIEDYPEITGGISFTVTYLGTTTTYYASPGMTWEEWCQGAYSGSGEYVVMGGYVCNADFIVLYNSVDDHTLVLPSDEIIEGGAYYIEEP